jgi:hypothetical protein
MLAGGDPNTVPTPAPIEDPSYEATYGSGGVIPSKHGNGELDSVRMTSGSTIVGTDDTMAHNQISGKGVMPEDDGFGKNAYGTGLKNVKEHGDAGAER